ncbi:hypothetical protein Tco_0304247 [Tanacetum coccineum]
MINGTKDTFTSCSNSNEQDMQTNLKRAKILKDLKLLSNKQRRKRNSHRVWIQNSAYCYTLGQDLRDFPTAQVFPKPGSTIKATWNKESFKEIGTMDSFRIPEFRDTLMQHMESVKKSIDERAQHKRKYDTRVNERQMQTTEGKDTSSRSGNDAHADDADIIPIYDEEPMVEVQMTAEINVFVTGQQYTKQPEFNNEGEVDQNAEQCHDTCPFPDKFTDNQKTELLYQSLESKNICLKKIVAQFQKHFLRMEAHCVNLKLKYQNQALKEWQHGQFLKVKSKEAKIKHDIYVIETINIELEHKVAKLLKENETLKTHYKELYDSIKTMRAKTIEHTTSLIAQNAEFKAQLLKKGFAITTLKNELRKLTGNSVNTKFAKSSILGKPVLQPHRNQSVVRQPTAFKSERPRISKPRFASQVDVNNDLPKPVTTHYLPRERESAFAKPHHMIAPGSSRYSSNDMVHNHYLEEAKKKTQESGRNSRPSVMPSARSQSTANGSKPKPRINNQKSRNWPASKTSCVTTKTVPIAEHSRNSRNFSDSKHFVCSTCQKCVFNANHDSCVTKFLNEVNSRAKVPSNKTTNRNKPVEQTSFAKKPERQIPKGHRFSIKKTSVVHEKTMTPRSCLRWKPTGKIFKTVGLRWVPTGKIFTSSTTKVDSEPTNGSNDDITNQYECKQTLDVSASTLNIHAGTSLNPTKEGLRVCSELEIHDHNNELSSSKLVPKVVPPADKIATSRQEVELLFHHHITMLRRPHALSWKPCQGDSLNLPDHRIHKDGDGDALYQLKLDSLHMLMLKQQRKHTITSRFKNHKLVMQKYGTNKPEDAYDRVLWSDLRAMFDPPLIEDAIWSLPLQQKMASWRYYDKCEVH